MLASDRDAAGAGVLAGIARAAVGRGHRVRLFLVGDGVRQVDLGVELAADGVEVSLCEADAALRGLHKTGQPGVFFGSLYDWARLVEDADRVLAFA
ncbi:MAG: DsrE/DsrF-like family, partial [Chloroflexota bacterium]|jgi:sulfur relay (sulfurtransferase) complex TusBCD TusD component (DsrE family)|nr:DsrE/DsrF-like family [Chloroflexota bacterium]